MTTLACRLLPQVLLPTLAAGVVFGFLDYRLSTVRAESRAEGDLRETVRVSKELLEAEVEEFQLLADTLLGQEALENHFLLTMAAMRDKAEDQRLQLEGVAARISELRSEVEALEFFRADGGRFIAIEGGRRSLRPWSAHAEEWWPFEGGDWRASQEGGALFLVKRSTLQSGLSDVIVRVTLNAEHLASEGLKFMAAGRDGVALELHGLDGSFWASAGAGQANDAIEVRTELGPLGAVLIASHDRAQIAAMVLENKRAIVGLMLILGLCLTFILWHRLRGVVLRPIAQLSQTLDQLGAGESTGQALAERHAELAALDQGLRTSFARQREATEELEVTNSQLEQRVAERTEELEQLKDEAVEASRAKSQFLANMSHEIRTPMNGVIGMADVLASTPLEAEQQSYVDTIRRSGEALLGVINDILDFSKIEAGKLKVELVDYDLHGLVYDVANLFAESAESKGIELLCDVHPTVPTHVVGDPVRVRQVLINLVGNAIKFTKVGKVELRCRLLSKPSAEPWRVGMEAELEFEVIDSGVGIPAEVQETIFESFSQADISTTRQFGGTGLGLTISSRLVSLMGGEIRVSSEVEEGSTFSFALTVRVSNECGQVYEDMLERLRGLRFLLVDDVACNRTILERHLAAVEIDCVLAEDGPHAMEILKSEYEQGRRFDVVILDQHMPGMSGVELSRRTEDLLRETNTPSVLLSSVHGDVEWKSAPIEFSLIKPVRPSVLLTGVDAMLRRRAGCEEPSTDGVTQNVEDVAQFAGRVLLAEDNRVNQMVARRMLTSMGFELDVVENGKEAVEAVSQASYRIVFMDCQMPIMDGYEASAKIRAGHPGQLIIAMTANAMQGDRERCLAAGMNDYVSKPIRQQDLQSVLSKWLNERQADAA